MEKKIGVIGIGGTHTMHLALENALKEHNVGVVTVGADYDQTTIQNALNNNDGVKVVVAVVDDQKKPDNTFVLNGVRYTPIYTGSNNKLSTPRSKINETLSALSLAASMVYLPYMGMMDYGQNDSYSRELPLGIDIIKEYGLIQQKKSMLTKWERNKVVNLFERTYRIVSEND